MEESGVGPAAGVGLRYHFRTPLSLHFEAERFFDTAGTDIDLISGGLAWRF